MHRLLSAFLVLLSSCLAETLTSCLLLILEIKNYFKCTFTFTVNTLKSTRSVHQKHQIIYETKKQSRQRYLFRNKFFCFDFLKNAHISMYWCSSKPLSLLILFLLLTWSLSSSLSFLFPFLLSSFLPLPHFLPFFGFLFSLVSVFSLLYSFFPHELPLSVCLLIGKRKINEYRFTYMVTRSVL